MGRGRKITKEKTNKIDMTQGSLGIKLWKFALPVAASSILQQLFNSVDVAVIGQYAGSHEQAAVGSNGSLINLLLNLFIGISVGANVVISTYLGQREEKKVHKAVHTAIPVALISGCVLLFFGIAAARPILTLMDTPKAVLDFAVLYLRIYFLGMPFIMFYNFGAAILRSIGDTKRPLYCLVLSGMVNVGLNLFFVIVFRMGVAGVAIATVISNVISAGMVGYFLTHTKEAIRLELRQIRISGAELKEMLKIGIPAGIQSVVFSLSNVLIQSAVNRFGADAMAGSAVSLNFEYYSYFIIAAFNQATVTFTSQNYGAGKYDRCKKVFWYSMVFSVVTTLSLDVIFMAGHKWFVALFTTDSAVAKYAVLRMETILIFYFMASSYEVGGAALRGMGYSLTPAVLTMFGSCVFRIIWIYTVCRIYKSFETLILVYRISWVITGTAVLTAYFLIRKKAFQKEKSTL